MLKVSDRLRDARGNIPRDKVCHDLGIARSTLAMYETGRRIPRDEIKIALANYYNLPVQELFY